MDRYTLVIVDDEEDIRNGLRYGIDWEELGFCVVGTAGNGAQALSIVQSNCPDVLITDIRMPGMDGIELVHQLRKLPFDGEIVILSGYSDIEYYRKALSYHIFGYILKPSSEEDISKLFCELREKLNTEKARFQKISQMEERIQRDQIQLKYIFLSSLLEPAPQDADRSAQRCCEYEMSFYPSELYYVIMFGFQNGQSAPKGHADERREKDLLARLHSSRLLMGKAEFFPAADRHVYGIVACCNEDEYRTQAAELNVFLQGGRKDGNLAGVSACHRSMQMLYQAKIEAQLSFQQIDSKSSLMFAAYPQVMAGKIREIAKTDFDVAAILEGLLMGGNNWRKEIERFFENFCKSTVQDHAYVDSLCHVLYQKVVSSQELLGISLSESEKMAFYTELCSKISLKEKKEHLLKTFDAFCKNEKNRKESETGGVDIAKINNFINSYFAAGEISLQKIATMMDRSPAYISSYYKRKTGRNIMDVITEKRIEYAKTELISSNIKISDLAQKAGYSDTSYFIRVFRRHVGISPMAYRAKVRYQNET